MLGESRSNQRATPPTSASQRTRAVALSNLDEECLDSLNRQSKEDVFPESKNPLFSVSNFFILIELLLEFFIWKLIKPRKK